MAVFLIYIAIQSGISKNLDIGQVLNNQIHCMTMAPKRLNFRMRIPSDFRKDWDLFNKRCKIEGMTPANLLQDLIEEYLEEFREELEKAEGELDKVAGPLRDAPPKKVTIKKPKKKSFLAKKAIISKRAEQEEQEDIDIGDTPKFKFLTLVKNLDIGSGIPPEELLALAGEEGIPNPRLQMNKMIRRGILYVHLGRIHVT